MEKQKKYDIKEVIRFSVIVLFLLFLIISYSLMIKPAFKGICNNFSFIDDGEILKEVVPTTGVYNYSLLKVSVILALILSVGLFSLELYKFIINKENKEDIKDNNKTKKINKIIKITQIVIGILLLSITIYLAIIFPNDIIKYNLANNYYKFSVDKYNNYSKGLSISSVVAILLLYSLILENEFKLYDKIPDKFKEILGFTAKLLGVLLIYIYMIISTSLIIKPIYKGIYNFNNDIKKMQINQNYNYTLLKVGVLISLIFVILLTILTIINYILESKNKNNNNNNNNINIFNKIYKITNYVILALFLSINIIFAIILPSGTTENWDNIDSYNNYSKTLSIVNIIVAITLIIYAISKDLNKEDKFNFTIKDLTEGAILVALAVVIDIVSDLLGLRMPQGGGFSIATLPIFIYALRKGSIHGLIAGILFSIINFLKSGHMIHWGSIFLDYIIAFGLLGFVSGIFSKKAKKGTVMWSLLAVFLGGFTRYICSSLSGVLFFKEYAPAGMNAYYYSFIFYNLPYNLVSVGASMVFISFLHKPLIKEETKIN